MTARYAANTTVSVQQTRMDLETVLLNYGADQLTYGWQKHGAAAVGFRMRGMFVSLQVPLPTPKEFERDGRGRRRTPRQQQTAFEQGERQRWRAVLILVKAKLEACASGISTIQREFLADTLFAAGGGGTMKVDDWLLPQLEESYASGGTPQMLALPAPREGS